MKRLIRLYNPKQGAGRGCHFNEPQGCIHATACTHNFGLLFNWRALWVGGHYSKRDKRLCVNLVPCLTFWWVKPGGKLP